MIKVWILVMMLSPNSYGKGQIVIDNIVSSDECQRVAKEIKVIGYGPTHRCIEYWRVK